MEEVEVQDILEKLGLDIPHPAPDSKEQWEEAYLCSFSPQHQSPPLPLQKKDYLPLKRCFHSFQELERKTSRAGFECMCCPQKDCPVFIGVERLTHSYPYSTNPNMVFPMYHERCKGSSRNVNAVNSSNSACPPAKRICTDVTSIVKETYAKSSNERTHHLQTTLKTCGIKLKSTPQTWRTCTTPQILWSNVERHQSQYWVCCLAEHRQDQFSSWGWGIDVQTSRSQ